MDLSKFKFKSTRQLTIVGLTLVATLVTLYVAYASLTTQNVSLNSPGSRPGAANPSCLLNLTLIKPSPSPTPIACVDATDIAIVIDRSSTMNSTESDGRKKLTWAKEAAVSFVDNIIASGRTNIRISVTSFGAQGNTGTRALASSYDSTLDIAATNNYQAVKTAINNIVYKQSGTCIQCGIRLGNSSLLSPASTNSKFVILLSDGMANHIWNGTTTNAKPLAITEANSGRAKGIVYYSIGFGVGTGNIDAATLTAIAGSANNYVYKPNVADWSSAFLSVLTKICGTKP